MLLSIADATIFAEAKEFRSFLDTFWCIFFYDIFLQIPISISSGQSHSLYSQYYGRHQQAGIFFALASIFIIEEVSFIFSDYLVMNVCMLRRQIKLNELFF
jgi:hypothetical protein